MAALLAVAVLVTLAAPAVYGANFTSILTTDARAWGDYNNDGYSDIFAKETYWTNNHANSADSFIERNGFLSALFSSDTTTLGDYDNDGDIDATGYIEGGSSGGQGPHPVIYRNDGGGNWTDVSNIAQPPNPPLAPLSVNRDHLLVDMNNDGYLDIFASSWVTQWPGNNPGPPDVDIPFHVIQSAETDGFRLASRPVDPRIRSDDTGRWPKAPA